MLSYIYRRGRVEGYLQYSWTIWKLAYFERFDPEFQISRVFSKTKYWTNPLWYWYLLCCQVRLRPNHLQRLRLWSHWFHLFLQLFIRPPYWLVIPKPIQPTFFLLHWQQPSPIRYLDKRPLDQDNSPETTRSLNSLSGWFLSHSPSIHWLQLQVWLLRESSPS